jgi:hypothetical protein
MRPNRRQTVLNLRQLESLKLKLERRLDNIKRELVTTIQMIEQTKKVLAKQELEHLQKEIEANAIPS